MEQWKEIEGYDHPYQVSNYGRIKLSNGRITEGFNDGYGYKRICLRKDKKNKQLFVHQLVGLYFIPNPNNYTIINHKDEVKTNNNVDNLEWCTQKDNVCHGTCQQRRIEKVSKGKIIQYDKQGNIIKIWDSLNSLRLNGHVAAWRAITRGNTNRFHDNSFWFRETERFDITKGKCLTLNIK